jgi:hypothetical protein
MSVLCCKISHLNCKGILISCIFKLFVLKELCVVQATPSYTLMRSHPIRGTLRHSPEGTKKDNEGPSTGVRFWWLEPGTFHIISSKPNVQSQ